MTLARPAATMAFRDLGGVQAMSRPDATPPRLFVALPVPERVADALAAWLAVWRAGPGADLCGTLRWTRPEGWHLTLAFLGATPHHLVDAVVDQVRDAVAARPLPDRLSLDRPGRFGGRVLWLGVRDEPSGAVAELGATVQERLVANGLPVARQPVRAHLTLARARGGRRVTDAAVAALSGEELPRDAWRPDAVHVMASELGQGPARYHTAARVLPPRPSPQNPT